MEESKRDRVRSHLRALPGAVVGFSGGVDSTLLAKLARDALGDRSLAVTARSESLAADDLEEARALAFSIGIRHEVVDTRELANPAYAANDARRCYYCKEELVAKLWEIARASGLGAVLLGNIADDASDDRPGLIAARQGGAQSPFLAFGLAKEEVRAWARELNLPNWDKPQAACLASRIATGEAVTAAKLSRVERAEAFVRGATGIRQLRVRMHGDLARIEVVEADLARLLASRGKILDALQGLGFSHVSMDLAGYQPAGPQKFRVTSNE